MYNVLIVEDELIELEALRKIIHHEITGINVYEANRGNEAIRLIDELNKIDLILVDINIPLPNGLDVIRYLRNKSNDTKIIVTTANDDIDMARHMFGLKVDDYLLKPIKPKTLVSTIKNSLEFNEQQNNTIKQQKIEMGNLIDSFQYIDWINLILEKLSTEKTLSTNENERAINNFINILHQIMKERGWMSSVLHEHELFLSNVKVNKSNYYKILKILMLISHDIFDIANKTLGTKLEAIQRAQYYIERNILTNISLDDVANHSYISSCYLSRLFKKQLNIGFSQYLYKRKMELATRLLCFSDLQINTIALELAYNDVNYFCRLFKKEIGCSPSEYRNRLN